MARILPNRGPDGTGELVMLEYIAPFSRHKQRHYGDVHMDPGSFHCIFVGLVLRTACDFGSKRQSMVMDCRHHSVFRSGTGIHGMPYTCIQQHRMDCYFPGSAACSFHALRCTVPYCRTCTAKHSCPHPLARRIFVGNIFDSLGCFRDRESVVHTDKRNSVDCNRHSPFMRGGMGASQHLRGARVLRSKLLFQA